jgi:retron-type reverse transcriptase
MADNDKARLYRDIVKQTDDHTLLEQMRLQGFWPEREGLPIDPAAEIEERARIEKELANLRKANALVKNPQKALAQERKRRWEESKQRRAETKKQRAKEQEQRREAWEAYRKVHAVHLGHGVSAGLQQTVSNVEALNQRGLPVMHNSTDLAARLGIKLSALRWLTYHRKGATVVHYHRFAIAKKTGDARCISAPKPALAHAQRWVLDNILNKLQTEPCAHGFLAGRSIVSNAAPHAGKQVVLNLDLKDFFPSITFRRVKGLFHKLGYSEHVATVLSLFCTEPPRVAAAVDGKVYHVALGARILPQGACTSPAITNALCRRLDRRLSGLARKHQFTFTRYADDLTFSGDRPQALGRLLRSVRTVLEAEGFAEHPTKTRIMRRAQRQEVTGLTVNTGPKVRRAEVRRLRAILHNAARHGLASQNRDNRPDFAAYLRGKVEYVCMVDPRQRPRLRRALAAALARPE